MTGRNPYIDVVEYVLPTGKYQLTLLPEKRVIEVDPEQIPEYHDGLPCSILQILLASGVEIDHACGGVCACSTCHVIVREGLPTCNESTDDEEDQLDLARGLTVSSRLACQCVPDGTTDMVVEIPEWNVNLISEEH